MSNDIKQKYLSTKTFGHDLGISCAFRQWRAVHSHCSKIHGYALSFHFVFEAEQLDQRNWVMDFGGFKALKDKVVECFDHKLVVAEDDPMLDELKKLDQLGVADVVVLPAVGCEMFAHYVYEIAKDVLHAELADGRVRLKSVEVREHGANSASYVGI
ncbi:6-pyruvoyl trahydropterin synthase family protein [Acinetobacter rudis]|uniref:6-carboxy-5,6,7,8-tetrahydropterin synthase n=1 Tax=Acinetobacter rudis TaxID=632955 RepID=A0AAW8JBI1_9GAMM|nr:6-carboxytetrahydropterin synthase [Acinetobacter rudis]MDQ8936036.1 6-carboxytetrahydropterin synthase [Acinetobacter rudis]MDQ9018299.1 6-carboxytetrahydropterin synthase [Acinetobacter rudis]